MPQMPLIGPTARAMRFLFVDRKTAAGAMEQSKKGAAAANGNNTQRIQQRTLDTRFPPLWIAPEVCVGVCAPVVSCRSPPLRRSRGRAAVSSPTSPPPRASFMQHVAICC